MHLRTLLLSQGRTWSNSKQGCRVSALHFFVKKKVNKPPMAIDYRRDEEYIKNS